MLAVGQVLPSAGALPAAAASLCSLLRAFSTTHQAAWAAAAPVGAPDHQQQHAAAVSLAQAYLHASQPGQASEPPPRLPRFLPKVEQQPLPALAALQRVKAQARARFPETIEAHIRLKVDPRRGDQMVRGAAVLPHSLGKPQRIAVFAEGRAAEQARAAGADVVGSEELVLSILEAKGKGLDFTACIATPDLMPKLVRLGRILGPKGLMPNPKMGTLTEDVAAAVAELRRGRVEFKMDRGGIVHAPLGRRTFDDQALLANLGALSAALLAAKPEAVKGGLARFFRSVALSSTMGAGSVPVDTASLPAAMEAAAAALQQAGDT